MKSPASYRLSRGFAAVGVAFFLYLYASVASALPFTLTINQPDRLASAGSTSLFSGTIANNSGGSVLASDLFLDFSGFDPLVVSLTQLLGSPDFVIADGATSSTVDLFTLDPASTALGGLTYFADVFVQDGSNPANFSNLATVSVTVVPEPATVMLFGIGLLAFLFRAGHIRSSNV
jgi:hypothetical protein